MATAARAISPPPASAPPEPLAQPPDPDPVRSGNSRSLAMWRQGPCHRDPRACGTEPSATPGSCAGLAGLPRQQQRAREPCPTAAGKPSCYLLAQLAAGTSRPPAARQAADAEQLGATGKRRRPGHRSGGCGSIQGRQGLLRTARGAGGLPGACRHQGAKRARCSLLFSYHSANWGVQTCRWGQSRSQRARISCWASSLARRSRKCSIARRLKLTTKCWR